MKRTLLIILASISIVFIPVIFLNQSIYIFPGDGEQTYYPFYIGLSQIIKNGIVLWYEPISFGSNIFIFAYAFLFSPFQWLFSLFNVHVQPYLFVYLDVIKFTLMGVFSYFWIGKLTKNKISLLIGTTVYTFSGFVIFFVHYSPFYDSYLLIPLILYLIEEIIQNNRKFVLFSLVIFLTVIINCYFFYIISWIIVFYFIFKIILINENFSIKNFSFPKNTFKLIGYYILGVLLSSIVLFPTVNIILNSPRLSVDLSSLPILNVDKYSLFNFVSTFYSPIITDYESNVFISKLVFSQSRISYHYSLVIYPFIVFLYLLNFKKVNMKYLFIIILFYILSFSPFINLLLNGNSNDIRWHIWITILHILLIINTLDNFKQFNKYTIVFSFLINVVFLLAISYISLHYNLLNKLNVKNLYIIIAFNLLLLVFYLFYFIKAKMSQNWMVVLLILEAAFLFYQRVYEYDIPTYLGYSDVDLTYQEDIDVVNQIKNMDNSFYRIEFVGSLINHPSMFNYPGFTFYQSLYNSNVRDYLDYRYSDYWIIDEVDSKWLSKNLLSGKYIVLGKDDSNYTIPFGYEFYFSTMNYEVYRNDYVTDFGFATNRVYSIDDISLYSKPIQDILFLQGIFTSSSQKPIKPQEFSFPTLIAQELINDQFSTSTEAGDYLIDYQKNYLYTSCEMEKYLNNVVSDYTSNYEYSFFTLRNDGTFDRSFVFCHSVYNQAQSVPFDIYFLSNEYLKNLYENKMNFDQVRLIESSANHYEAKVSLNTDDSMLFLSIPYDDGWDIKVNDESHSFEKVNDGFIGLKIEKKGSYTITMDYQPKWFKQGILVTIVASFILIILTFRIRLRKNNI